MTNNLELATFGGGCFWCTEAVFKRVKGVTKVTSGYAGGKRENPNYEQVVTGVTGHAESIQLEFDPTVITYDTLLDIFWATHDPTTLNRQGYDTGTQYRSIIFYHDDTQKKTAEASLEKIQKEYKDTIVTEITALDAFYTAEQYHQNFYDNNRDYSYCSIIIDPKVKKLLEKFGNNVKDEYKE